jgi:hypothetical protein
MGRLVQVIDKWNWCENEAFIMQNASDLDFLSIVNKKNSFFLLLFFHQFFPKASFINIQPDMSNAR